MFFGPHLLEADDGRCRQTWRVADEGRQHFLEVAGRDSLQVEDGDQHLKALRSPRVSRQDRWRVSDALAFARCTVAHPRLANGDRADAGHDVALWKMAMTHHALMARLGLEIRMLCEKLSNLRLDRLSQQRTRAAAQDLCQGVGEDPWLGELDDVIVGHGVSLLHWRSGGVEHHHDTPPYPVSPSPTSGHSSRRRDKSVMQLAVLSGHLDEIRCSNCSVLSNADPGFPCFEHGVPFSAVWVFVAQIIYCTYWVFATEPDEWFAHN